MSKQTILNQNLIENSLQVSCIGDTVVEEILNSTIYGKKIKW